MARFAFLVILGLVSLPSAASAQELPVINPGARVRVWTSPTAGPVTGKVTSVDASTVTIAPEVGDALISLPSDAITRLDVSRGGRSRGRNALVGALIGVGVGVVGLVASSGSSGVGPSGGEVAIVVFAPAGALIGSMVGPGPERWTSTTVRPNRLAGLTVAPAAPLRFSFRF